MSDWFGEGHSQFVVGEPVFYQDLEAIEQGVWKPSLVSAKKYRVDFPTRNVRTGINSRVTGWRYRVADLRPDQDYWLTAQRLRKRDKPAGDFDEMISNLKTPIKDEVTA